MEVCFFPYHLLKYKCWSQRHESTNFNEKRTVLCRSLQAATFLKLTALKKEGKQVSFVNAASFEKEDLSVFPFFNVTSFRKEDLTIY